MKLILSSIFLLLFFICAPVLSQEIYKEYTVKVSGIKIGVLGWTINISDTNYTNELKLTSKGLLSKIYWFEGKYFSQGIVQNSLLKPTKYKHFWKTNKITKNMDLVFEDDKLVSLNQSPVEKENLRTDVFGIRKNNDPLTSFLQIIMGATRSQVIDGRRLYSMNAYYDDNDQIIVEISNYINLWTDHKRSDFEKIIFKKEDGKLLPVKISIYFDGRVFNLQQD